MEEKTHWCKSPMCLLRILYAQSYANLICVRLRMFITCKEILGARYQCLVRSQVASFRLQCRPSKIKSGKAQWYKGRRLCALKHKGYQYASLLVDFFSLDEYIFLSRDLHVVCF